MKAFIAYFVGPACYMACGVMLERGWYAAAVVLSIAGAFCRSEPGETHARKGGGEADHAIARKIGALYAGYLEPSLPSIDRAAVELIRQHVASALARSAAQAGKDSQRLDWLIKHSAIVVKSSRQKTRRGKGPENYENGFTVDYLLESGDEIIEGADLIEPTERAAIDAASERSAARKGGGP